MASKFITTLVILLAIVFGLSLPGYAQDLRPPTRNPSPRLVPLLPPTRGPVVASPVDIVRPLGQECLCTNLGDVSLVCLQCDAERDVDQCHLHDQHCQETARRNGIREFRTFYCVSQN